MKQPVSITDATKSGSGTYLSNKYQDLLLYGALVEAYGYLKGPIDMLQYYEASYKRALASYSIEQEGRRRETNTKMVLFVMLLNHHHHNKEIKYGKYSTKLF